MKQCKQCSVELISGENIAPSAFKNYDYHCKPCKKKYLKKYNVNNQSQIKVYQKKYSKKYYESRKDGHFSVYLLPDHNYAGMTGNLYHRMSDHRSSNGRNTDNVRVLYTTKSKDEALELEALLHDIGYEGKADSWATRRKY